jgi:ubiquitin-conjugating enzyme E2 J1
MPTKAEGAVGAVDTTDGERKSFARQSHSWKCPECKLHIEPDPVPGDPPRSGSDELHVDTPEVADEAVQVAPEPVVVEDIPRAEDVPEGEVHVDQNDGIRHWNYEEMRSIPLQSRESFIPLLDIPIVILFLLLVFLVANSTFEFVNLLE